MKSTLSGRQLGLCPILNFLPIYSAGQHVGILNFTYFEHSGIILRCLLFQIGDTTHQRKPSTAGELRFPARSHMFTGRSCHTHWPILPNCKNEKESERW